MRIVALFVCTFFCFASGFSQDSILLDMKINVVRLIGMPVNDLDSLLGKPTKIERSEISQPFCGMTKGRDEHLTFRKSHLTVTTRKRMGYVKKEDLDESNASNYYKDCRISQVQFTETSRLTLFSIPGDSITQTNLESKLNGLAKKLAANEYVVTAADGSQFRRQFCFRNGKLNELVIRRYYSTPL